MSSPAARDELLVKKSIAAVDTKEAEMVERTLEDTKCKNRFKKILFLILPTQILKYVVIRSKYIDI